MTEQQHGHHAHRQTLLAARDVAGEWGIAKAAWQLEDALMDTGIEVYPDLPGGPKGRAAHFKFVWAEVGYKRALLAMVILSIFETPSWCRHELDFSFQIEERCDLSEGTMTSGIPYISPGWCLVIEVFLMAILFRKLWLELWVQTQFFDQLKQEYAKRTYVRFGMCMLALEAADVVFFAIFRPRFRFAFVARAGYLCLLPAVTKLVSCVLMCLAEMVSVAVFLVGVILFFAWIAVTIFKDLDQGNEGFNTFRKSLNSMFIAGVSDEFVSVFLKSYTCYRWVGILWLIFLVIAHVLLLSLVLDTLCAAYMTYSEHSAEAMAKRKLKGIAKAFETLSTASGGGGSSQVTKNYFVAFVEEFGKSPRMAKIPSDQAVIMWDAIDADNSGAIEKEEFNAIVSLIQYDFWTTTKDSFVKTRFPALWDSEDYKKFRAFVGSGDDDEDEVVNGWDFERVMNLVLVANLALVVCETYCDLHKWEEPPWMDQLELIFSFVYLGELGAKLCVISFEEYRSSVSNKFDFFTTWLLLGTSIAERLFASGLSTYANMLRLLRLLRVVKNLKNLETVQFMIDTVSKLVLSAKDMLTLLGVVVFFFTMASVQAFGGDLYEGNEALEGTEYLEKHMLVLNFNDVPSAFGCWVVMLLCEYEPNFPEAVSKTSAIPWSWMMFPIFYVCGVSIVFELVKAFTIEVFMSLKNRWEQQKKKRMLKPNATHEDDMVEFVKAFEQTGKKLHYRIRGDPSQLEQIKEAQEKLEKEEMEGEGGHGGSGHGHGHGHG